MKKMDVQSLRRRITKTDEKWRISVKARACVARTNSQSFTNEQGFYSEANVLSMRDFGVHVPAPYHIGCETTDDTEFVRDYFDTS